jgi:hypothetical protein
MTTSMGKKDRKQAALTPAQALDSLPKLEFDARRSGDEQELQRAELLQSVLAIAQVDHLAESRLVRSVVRNAGIHLPEDDG